MQSTTMATRSPGDLVIWDFELFSANAAYIVKKKKTKLVVGKTVIHYFRFENLNFGPDMMPRQKYGTSGFLIAFFDRKWRQVSDTSLPVWKVHFSSWMWCHSLLRMCNYIFDIFLSQGHIGIAVPDVAEACRQFEAKGVEFVKKPDDGNMKGIAFIKDPDGYWIEIFSPRTIAAIALAKWSRHRSNCNGMEFYR